MSKCYNLFFCAMSMYKFISLLLFAFVVCTLTTFFFFFFFYSDCFFVLLVHSIKSKDCTAVLTWMLQNDIVAVEKKYNETNK